MVPQISTHPKKFSNESGNTTREGMEMEWTGSVSRICL
jgi:hypothetical protein